MLEAVEFDDEAGVGAEEIDFHGAVVVEGDGKHGIELELLCKLRVGFKSPVEKCFAGAAGAGVAFGIGGWRARGVNKKLSERCIDAIADQAAHAGGVVGFPLRGNGERHGGGPAGKRAGRQQDGIANSFVALTTAVEHAGEHGNLKIRLWMFR